jgi:glutathione S-transferase
MPLILYYHPLSSFCWKPLVALYEKEIAFTPHLVNLGDEKSREEFYKVWPMGQFPVLRDETREATIPQSSAIIEYLDLTQQVGPRLLPLENEAALEARRWDSFCDCNIQVPMQKIVGDCLRPANAKDPFGVDEARRIIKKAYGVLNSHLNESEWMIGPQFSLADCAAAPALYYANIVEPLGEGHLKVKAYLERLVERPSFRRVLAEAAPYFSMFPYGK